MSTTKELQPGDTYVVLKSGFSWMGDIRRAGERVKVTRDDDPDRLALVLDIDAQIARWGEQRLSVELPEGFEPWPHGSPEWELARAKAREEAYALPTEAERHAAFQAMHRRFGPPPVTSRSHALGQTSFDREYEAQQERLNNPSAVYSNNSITTIPDESKPQTARPNRTVLR